MTTILTVLSLTSRVSPGGLSDGSLGQPTGPEWFQFLPISIGGNVFNALPGAGGISSGDITAVLLKPVPFPIAMAVVLIYLVAAIAIALVALHRQEIA